jgi:mono/diheme cytochrome c family protein
MSRHRARRRLALCVVALKALLLAWLVHAAEPTAAVLPEGEGQALAQRLCSQCHSVELVMRHRLSKTQWAAQIDVMIAKGAKVDDDEFEALAEYLARALGPDAR